MATETGKGLVETVSSKAAYIGAGAGLCLFAVFGLIHASFIGGLLGLNIAGKLFGYPIEPTLMSRAIIAFGMLTGIMAAGLLFVIAGAAFGWLVGMGIQAVVVPSKKQV